MSLHTWFSGTPFVVMKTVRMVFVMCATSDDWNALFWGRVVDQHVGAGDCRDSFGYAPVHRDLDLSGPIERFFLVLRFLLLEESHLPQTASSACTVTAAVIWPLRPLGRVALRLHRVQKALLLSLLLSLLVCCSCCAACGWGRVCR